MADTIYTESSPPIKNSAFVFDTVLFSQADTKIIKTSPTLAVGDVKVGGDGQAPANTTSLPSGTVSGAVYVWLSAVEMNYDRVLVIFTDATGAEWCSQAITIHPKVAKSIPTAAEIAIAVWANATRTLSSFGTLVADIWAYVSRTLTQTLASITSTIQGTTITIQRGDTLTIPVTGLASNTGYVSIDFTVKRTKYDPDEAALICIRKNASGVGDGLLYVNGQAPTVAGLLATVGSITVVSATSITIALSAAATKLLPAPITNGYYDIQYIFASTVLTASQGTCAIDDDVRQAVA